MLVPPLWGSMLKAIPDATVDGFVVVGLEVGLGVGQTHQPAHLATLCRGVADWHAVWPQGKR